jgi:hypothetical protein
VLELSNWGLALKNLKSICLDLESGIKVQLNDYLLAVSAREDSRAFGAMIEKRITETWVEICSLMGVVPLELPGRRSIFDCAFVNRPGFYGDPRVVFSANAFA